MLERASSAPRAATVASLTAALLVVSAAPAPALALAETPDTTWMANKMVRASVQVGNTLYIGGIFTEMQDAVSPTTRVSAQGLAAIDVTTGAAIPSFAHDVAWSSGAWKVLALAVSVDQSTLYVGGTFDSIDGVPVSHVAAIDLAVDQVIASFAPTVTSGATATPQVSAILPTATRIYLGGKFSKVNGLGRAKLAAVDPAGTLDTTWKPKANDRVNALTLDAPGATIFVGGNFETIKAKVNGALTTFNRQSIARLTLDTGVPTSWQLAADPQMTGNRVHVIVATSNRLYLGTGAKGPNWVGSYDLTAPTGTLIWKYGTVGNVQTLALSADGSRLFFGGHFGTGELQQEICGGKFLRGLSVINSPGTTGSHAPDCSWVPNVEPFGSNFNGIWTLQLSPTYLWSGGRVDAISGVPQRNVARFTL